MVIAIQKYTHTHTHTHTYTYTHTHTHTRSHKYVAKYITTREPLGLTGGGK